jgi:hypothetical protein
LKKILNGANSLLAIATPGRSFTRSSLAEMADEIREGLSGALRNLQNSHVSVDKLMAVPIRLH